eukprot:359651-Chlamydomonas_euryale.AAC.5
MPGLDAAGSRTSASKVCLACLRPVLGCASCSTRLSGKPTYCMGAHVPCISAGCSACARRASWAGTNSVGRRACGGHAHVVKQLRCGMPILGHAMLA